jgi:type I restriction enzyme S subunit
MHPRRLRCSSLKYSRYSRSSRLAGGAPRPSRCDARLSPRAANGWTWTQLGAVARLKGGLTKGQKRRPTDVVRSVPYLRVANVQRGYLDLSEVKLIEAMESEVRDLRLEPGDLLFNEGGDRDKLGRGWVWNGEIAECIHQNHVFRARLLPELEPRFFSLFSNFVGHQYFFDEGKQTTNLASINISKLSRLPVPVAPAAEQTRILTELDRHFSVLAHMETAVEEQLSRATALRRGILRHAFAGKLTLPAQATEPVFS